MDATRWRDLATAQEGLLSHRQLRELGVSYGEIRHHVEIGRWAPRSREVVSTTTGPLSPGQRLWLGVLHAGHTAMIGGLSALAVRGLKRWPRDEMTVWVSNPMSFEPLPGFCFFRTRRQRSLLLGRGELPVADIEPSVLIFAAHEPHLRTALGAVTAVIQQRLSTTEELRRWLGLLTPLRRARQIRELLLDVEGGAHSLAEVDVRKACRDFELMPPSGQTTRRDSRGRRRFTDCEWRLPDGRVIVLEVDGAFHDEVEQATEHRRRNRRLASASRMVIQCSAWEIRHEPWEVMQDLVALGVPHHSGRVRRSA